MRCSVLVAAGILVAAAPIASAAAADDLVGLFGEACLGQFPVFEGTPAIFERIGWAETRSAEFAPARYFERIGEGAGMIETGIGEEGQAPLATCIVILPGLDSDVPVASALERVGAMIAATDGGADMGGPDCIGVLTARSCTWVWKSSQGCRSVIGTEIAGALMSLTALSYEDDALC